MLIAKTYTDTNLKVSQALNLKSLKGKVIKKILFRRYEAKRKARIKAQLLSEQRAKFSRPIKVLDMLTFKDLDVNDPFEVALDKLYRRVRSQHPNFIQFFPNKKQVKYWGIKVYTFPEPLTKKNSIVKNKHKVISELHLEKCGGFFFKQKTLEPYVSFKILTYNEKAYESLLLPFLKRFSFVKNKSEASKSLKKILPCMLRSYFSSNFKQSFWFLFKKPFIPEIRKIAFNVMRKNITKFSEFLVWSDIESRLLVKNSFEWSVLLEINLKHITPFGRSSQWLPVAKQLTPFTVSDHWTFCVYWYTRIKNKELIPDNYYLVNSQWPIFHKSNLFLNYQNSFMRKGLRNSLKAFYNLIKRVKFLGLHISKLIYLILEQMRPFVFFIGCKRHSNTYKVMRALDHDRQMLRSIVWNKQDLVNQGNEYFLNRLIFNFFSKLTSPEKTFQNRIALNDRLKNDRGLINIRKWDKRTFGYKKKKRNEGIWEFKKPFPTTFHILTVRQRFKECTLKYNECSN